MNNLEFRSGVNAGVLPNGRIRRLLRGNEYRYNNLIKTNIRYIEGDKEIPYILLNSLHSSDNILRIEPINKWVSSLTVNMLKDIIDSAHAPVLVKIISQRMHLYYLAGKGFLARWFGKDKDIKMLFVACKPADIPKDRLNMKQITFYISRSINDVSTPKTVRDIIEEFAKSHVGDVVYTSDIEKYVGHNIVYPTFSTISQKKEYIDKLIDFCTNNIRKSL